MLIALVLFSGHLLAATTLKLNILTSLTDRFINNLTGVLILTNLQYSFCINSQVVATSRFSAAVADFSAASPASARARAICARVRVCRIFLSSSHVEFVFIFDM